MTLEFEGIFLVSWIFRIVILSYVTNQKINLYYLLLPFIFLGIYIINYDIVFWGEIFLLPLSLIIVKNKYNWNWSQYIFYSFFPFVIFEIFSNFANLYDRFLFRLSAAQWYNFFWSSWIDYCLGFLFCFGFFKLLQIDFKVISEELNRQMNFKKQVSLFCYSLIFYVMSVYLLDNLIHLSEYGYIVSSIDFVYLRRNILILYLIFTIGIIFKMNDQATMFLYRDLSRKNIFFSKYLSLLSILVLFYILFTCVSTTVYFTRVVQFPFASNTFFDNDLSITLSTLEDIFGIFLKDIFSVTVASVLCLYLKIGSTIVVAIILTIASMMTSMIGGGIAMLFPNGYNRLLNDDILSTPQAFLGALGITLVYGFILLIIGYKKFQNLEF